jgi:hypothetical protein
MSRETDKAAHHLIWVWFQYAGRREEGGKVYLDHQCMSAGEGAAEWLQDWGYATEEGCGCHLTPKGIAVMDDESLD